MATTYGADQVIGKTLYMNIGKNINLRALPDITSQLILNVKSGELVGNVYTYVVRTSGLWWMIERGNTKCWCLHYEGAFDIRNLASQGALTPKEIADRKAEAEKTFGDKTLDKITEFAKTAAYILGGYLALKVILNSTGNGNRNS